MNKLLTVGVMLWTAAIETWAGPPPASTVSPPIAFKEISIGMPLSAVKKTRLLFCGKADHGIVTCLHETRDRSAPGKETIGGMPAWLSLSSVNGAVEHIRVGFSPQFETPHQCHLTRRCREHVSQDLNLLIQSLSEKFGPYSRERIGCEKIGTGRECYEKWSLRWPHPNGSVTLVYAETQFWYGSAVEYRSNRYEAALVERDRLRSAQWKKDRELRALREHAAQLKRKTDL